MLYFDASYLVRLHTRDAGWEKVRALAATDTLACSLHGQAETVAAFHRKFPRGSNQLRKSLGEVLAEFERDSKAGAFNWLPVSPAVIARVVKGYGRLACHGSLAGSRCGAPGLHRRKRLARDLLQ